MLCQICSKNTFGESQFFKVHKRNTQITTQQNQIMWCEYEKIEQSIVSINRTRSHDIVLYKKCKNARLM